MRRVSFITLGCKVNQYDSQAMEKAFTQRGYAVVPAGEAADAVIVNTCTVTAEADRKSRQMIRRAVKANPGAVVAAAGCSVQGDPESAKAIEGVDIIAGSNDRIALVEAVVRALDGSGAEPGCYWLVKDISSFGAYEEAKAEGADGMSRAYLKIEDGCDAYCSYCLVPYVRGHVRSRDPGSVEEEASRLADAGYLEVVLTGIHLGCYGKDLEGVTLADAIKAAARPSGIKRVRLSSLEPTELTDEIIGLFASEPKLARHLHLPLQSGDDFVLRLMNRHYDAKGYEAAVEKARAAIGRFGLTTDVIAGFPGETERMFENTLSLVRRLGFLKVHAFPYSRRKGTPAAGLPGQVPEKIKHDRVAMLIEASKAGACEFTRGMSGSICRVIVEGAAPSEGGFECEGYTGEYVRVLFHADRKPEGCVEVAIMSGDSEGARGVLIDR
ncbi:MAG: Threonylcarbamoyladenosine tRNA methylthiotransferase MtaB [Firmicutes bacterium ADurb.Bin153]|nr:MAG: Threonylcarbamoyladenosine tRNA methylthiotransferase MtaB [Firmicutes bacterium ADurb.Bin153]